jgi:hypothetical protein
MIETTDVEMNVAMNNGLSEEERQQGKGTTQAAGAVAPRKCREVGATRRWTNDNAAMWKSRISHMSEVS